MSYERTIWKNREVEYPRRYIITDNGDGTVTIEPSPGNIIEPGTPIIAENMNNIEEGIVLSLSQIGDINDETLPAELKGKPLVEQIMYVLQHASKVKSVNGKTGEVTIDVEDIDGLSSKIIEATGSNSNGTYVRFGNGIQICFNVISSRSLDGNNVTELIWTFPATFLNATDYFVIADVGTSPFDFLRLNIIHSVRVSDRLSTRTTFYINNTSEGTSTSVYSLAIGRWK